MEAKRMAVCEVCFRHCDIDEGKLGFCGGRICRDGKVVAGNYGKATAIALDPIEKKPLRRFMPGSMILSVGSYGCNLRCPHCQNSDISWSDTALGYGRGEYGHHLRNISPQELARMALKYRDKGNAGVAFTYNEPLIGFEYVRDSARLVHEMGMKNVLVTNGTAELSVLRELSPYIDAMNIDIKGFTYDFYSRFIGGDLEMVKNFIGEAVKNCHVELTCLIIPGENDSFEEMDALTSWIEGLTDGEGTPCGQEVPLHISRFFPRFKLTDRDASDVKRIYELAELARGKLKYVYTGNC